MQRIQTLLQRFLANEANPEEIRELLQWLREHDHNEQLLQEAWEAQARETPQADWQRIWMQVDAATRPEPCEPPSGSRGDRVSQVAAAPGNEDQVDFGGQCPRP